MEGRAVRDPAAVDEIKSILRKIYIKATSFYACSPTVYLQSRVRSKVPSERFISRQLLFSNACSSTVYTTESRGHLVGRVLILESLFSLSFSSFTYFSSFSVRAMGGRRKSEIKSVPLEISCWHLLLLLLLLASKIKSIPSEIYSATPPSQRSIRQPLQAHHKCQANSGRIIISFTLGSISTMPKQSSWKLKFKDGQKVWQKLTNRKSWSELAS